MATDYNHSMTNDMPTRPEAEEVLQEKILHHSSAENYARIARIRAELHENDAREVARIFSQDFAAHLPALFAKKFVLDGEEFFFSDIIDAHIKNIEAATDPIAIARAQEKFIQSLVEKMVKLPVNNWAIDGGQLAKTGAANCSSAAAALQMILESTQAQTGISKIDHVNPTGHAFNMVTLPNGTLFYVDPRNGLCVDVTEQTTITNRDGLTIYTLAEPQPPLTFRHIPALNNSHTGIVAAYLGNLLEVPKLARGEFDAEFEQTFGFLSSEERAAMQRDVQPLTNKSEINSENIAATQALHKKLNKPIDLFYADPEIKRDIAAYEPMISGHDAKNEIGALLARTPDLAYDMRMRADELKQFLLGKIPEFKTTSDTLTTLLLSYRTHLNHTWTLVFRTEPERAKELDKIISLI